MHWHAYTWTGYGEERGYEQERRPDSPEFARSPLPPMRTGDWLAKPRAAATFAAVGDALAWLSSRHALIRDGDAIGLAVRLAEAADLLPRGVDVQWGEWLPGGRFAAVGMICCPNRHTTHPCPRPPR